MKRRLCSSGGGAPASRFLRPPGAAACLPPPRGRGPGEGAAMRSLGKFIAAPLPPHSPFPTPHPRRPSRTGGSRGWKCWLLFICPRGGGGGRPRAALERGAARAPPAPRPGRRAPRRGRGTPGAAGQAGSAAANKGGERPLHVCAATAGPAGSALHRESRPGPRRAAASRAAGPGEAGVEGWGGGL